MNKTILNKKGDIEQGFPCNIVQPFHKLSCKNKYTDHEKSRKIVEPYRKMPYKKTDIEKGLPMENSFVVKKDTEHQILDIDSSDDEMIEPDNFIKSMEDFIKDKTMSFLMYIKNNYENFNI